MIEIILSVCWLGDVQRCKDVTLSYLDDAVTVHACMLYGQSEIAKWTEGHPKWTVQRWSCGMARQVARI